MMDLRRGASRLPALAIVLLLALAGAGRLGAGEVFPYRIELVEVDFPGMPGLQSFAFGQHEGVWLLVGGRLDGIHARQPMRAFPPSENNTNLHVVDVSSREVWSVSVLDLPTGLAEQLQSTNLNFYQDGGMLYLIGGYGYSTVARDHVTYPYFTAVDVPGTIAAVREGRDVSPYFRQISSPAFAVTGGQLGKIGDELYLVGGHRFDGRYHPMGMGPFRQAYTNEVRVFAVSDPVISGTHATDSGEGLTVELVRVFSDPDHLRRRDYNLVPQLFPDGSEGYMISAGVFQAHVDLPFLYPVDIRTSGITPRESFDQYLSHYHSGKLPLYDEASGEMHSIFFGGIAQYYFRDGVLIRDDLVPFVDTISRVTRAPDDSFTEYVLPVTMPGLLGASGEFIPNPEFLRAGSRVIRTADIGGGPAVAGHLVGGIRSPELNPFFTNRTGLTTADSTIYAVVLTREPVVHTKVVR
jgi:hypothetical protein